MPVQLFNLGDFLGEIMPLVLSLASMVTNLGGGFFEAAGDFGGQAIEWIVKGVGGLFALFLLLLGA